MKMTKKKTKKPATKKAPAKAASTQDISITPIPLTQGGVTYFVFTMSAKTLWSLVQINRRQEDKDIGYQRALSLSRVRKISKFIDANNILPGAILVSFDHGKLHGDKLLIPNREDAGWVIDGQHRLAGAHEAKTEISLPVIAFLNLPLGEQINLFVTINREQKGVSSSLYYDLLKSLPREKTEKEIVEERANDIITVLKSDSTSPFYRRIVATTSPRAGQISATNFIRKLVPHIRHDGRLEGFSDEDRVTVLNNYYRGLQKAFPKVYDDPKGMFFKTLGFGALMNVLPTVIDGAFRLAKSASFRVQDVQEVFKLIPDFDMKAWSQMGTGTAAENQAALDLRTALLDALDAAGTTVRLS